MAIGYKRPLYILAQGAPKSKAGFIDFAVGRTDFWQPSVGFSAGTLTRKAAAAEIAQRFLEFVAIFERARAAPS